MSIKAQIELLGSDLNLGETLRDVCPLCGGGSQSEKSLAITRSEDGSLLYVCHRASCSAKGGTSKLGLSSQSTLVPEKKRKVFDGEVRPLPELYLDIIYKLWGISEPRHWYYTPYAGGRVAMSVRSPKYMHRGWVLRDIRGRAKVKALTYIDEGEEGLSWYREHIDGPTVVVEDIPSAVRASKYVNAVSLLGTGVGITRAEEIAQYATRPIVMALDQDATAQSFKMARRYALMWGDVEVLMLDKDIKDMEENEIELCLRYK